MKLKQILLASLVSLVMFSSCVKEDALPPLENIPGLGGDRWAKGPIDQWIVDSLTLPYNIAVKYKWDQADASFIDRTLVPPMEEKVIPVLSTIRTAWIEPYVAEAGLQFFKVYSPKFFVLVGSPAYNTDGSRVLGVAEGGRKVLLLEVNEFRRRGMPGYVAANDSSRTIEMFKTMHHEFAHILDQNKKVPAEFRAISANFYNPDWTNVTPQEAQNEGFVSPYANSKWEDDFAEMVSMMLIWGKPYFDYYVNSINYTGTTPSGSTAQQAKDRLRQKEAIIVNYFKQAWNIDFYSLQSRSRSVLASLL